MPSLILPSPAKLNLFLYITGKRDDGYHNLQTLFHFLDYGDELSFTRQNNDQITLLPALAGVKNADNLIIKAAKLLQSYTGGQQGVTITLNKKLPLGGGVGGASSNAATTLLALNHLWQCHLPIPILLKLGRQLGADVPIFIYGHSAFAEGVGDQLTPVDVAQKWYLVAYPQETAVSTALLFSDATLVRNSPVRSLAQLLKMPYSNNFEAVVKTKYPKIATIIEALSPHAPTRLTGTGCCVFAEFADQKTAQHACHWLPRDSHYFIAQGCTISPTHRKLATMLDNVVK